MMNPRMPAMAVPVKRWWGDWERERQTVSISISVKALREANLHGQAPQQKWRFSDEKHTSIGLGGLRAEEDSEQNSHQPKQVDLHHGWKREAVCASLVAGGRDDGRQTPRETPAGKYAGSGQRTVQMTAGRSRQGLSLFFCLFGFARASLYISTTRQWMEDGSDLERVRMHGIIS